MVKTSKGPAEKSEPKKAGTKAPAAKEQTIRPDDIDQATWDQIESLARSQQSTTGDVIRRAIGNQYGVAAPVGAYHSGSSTDPANQ